MSSKGVKRRRDDEEDEDKNEKMPPANGGAAGHSNNNNLATPPKAPLDEMSPPGTKLRSGRKVKPHRSLEEQMERANKRAKLSKEEAAKMSEDEAAEEEDEVMTEDVKAQDKKEGAKKPAATRATAASSAQQQRQQQPVNLRLPSQHTPGKHQPAAARPSLNASTIPAAAAAAAAAAASLHEPTEWKDDSKITVPQQQQRLNLTKTPHKKASDMAVASPNLGKKLAAVANGGVSSQDAAAAAAAAQRKHEPAPPGEDARGTNGAAAAAPPAVEEEAMVIPPEVDLWLSKPWVCFLLLGLLLVPRLFFIHPFLDSAVNTSKFITPFYRMLVPFKGQPVPVQEVINEVTEYTEKKVLSEATLKLIEHSKKINQTLAKTRERQKDALEDMVEFQSQFDEQSDQVEIQLETLQKTQETLQDALAESLSLMQNKLGYIETIATMSADILVPGSGPEEFDELLQSLNETDAASLVNLLDLKLWEPQLETCDIPEMETLEVNEDDKEVEGEDDKVKEPVVVTEELVLQYLEELEEEMDEEFKALKTDNDWKKAIMKWVKDFMDERLEVFVDANPPPDTSGLLTVSSTGNAVGTSGSLAIDARGGNVEAIRKIVDSRLEVLRADMTGRIDFAALHQGASVVRVGSSATSPSLVDSLPLANRLMAFTGTQFYGYGPEAALTPTYPVDSVGQCWSFVKDVENNRFGSFAILTVKLAKPIFAQSVIIEHPLQSQSKQTPIRNFRVYGYTDQDAESKSYDLGGVFHFETIPRKRKHAEEFKLNGVDEKGEKVPRLGAISLVIDSTWGRDNACLYRFRVHGRE